MSPPVGRGGVAFPVLLTLAAAGLAGPMPRLSGPSQAPVAESAQQEEVVLGKPSAFSLESETGKHVLLEAGSRLRADPRLDAPILTLIAEDGEAPVLERLGAWAKVRHRYWQGWVFLDGRDTGPLLPSPRFREVRLARVLGILGERAERRHLGPYELHTDVRDERLLEMLHRAASGLHEVYLERYGLDPGPPAGDSVVLFASERDYRAYERDELKLAGLRTQGHTAQAILTEAGVPLPGASRALSATFVGKRRREEVLQIVLHEMTHLLNRRALGDRTSPWLEEALADDLAFSQIDAAGRILPGTLGGEMEAEGTLPGRSRDGRVFEMARISGARESLWRLLAFWNLPYRPALPVLLELPWEDFAQPDLRDLYYAESAFFVRYLLDGRKERLREGFHAFLADVAAGKPADRSTLSRRLGVRLAALERGYSVWLWAEANAHGIPRPSGGA